MIGSGGREEKITDTRGNARTSSFDPVDPDDHRDNFSFMQISTKFACRFIDERVNEGVRPPDGFDYFDENLFLGAIKNELE